MIAPRRSARRRACCGPEGRLLVVDLAPHDLEFLREEHAHLRLGFATDAVAQWMTTAGLDVVLEKSLPPEPESAWARSRSRCGLPATGGSHSPEPAGRSPDGLTSRRAAPEPFDRRPSAASASRSSSSRRKAEMENNLWAAVRRLAPLGPSFVSVPTGPAARRASAPTRRSSASWRDPWTGGAPDLRRGDLRRDRRGRPRLSEAGVGHIVALRGDPPGGAGSATPHPGGYADPADWCRHQAHRRYRGLGLRLSGAPSRKPDGGSRHRHARRQGRRRRQPRHHPVLLRQRPLLALPRPRPRARHRHPDRPRHPARAELQAGENFARRSGTCVPDGWRTASRASRTTSRREN